MVMAFGATCDTDVTASLATDGTIGVPLMASLAVDGTIEVRLTELLKRVDGSVAIDGTIEVYLMASQPLTALLKCIRWQV